MKNNHSHLKMIGSSAHSDEEREPLDFYATDPEALDNFLEHLAKDRIQLHQNIWECACGDGSLSSRLREHNFKVFSTDIVQRNNAAVTLFDFINDELPPWHGDILTNPPYRIANSFLTKALEVVPENNFVVFFLRLQFLEGKKRRKLFEVAPPKFIYVHSSRVHTLKNNDPAYRRSSSAICFAWFIWQKGFQGDPVVRWID